jgi:hypothetical protein
MYQALKEQGARIHFGYISLYEIGERSPNLLVLLAYSKITGISLNVLVDDTLDLDDR